MAELLQALTVIFVTAGFLILVANHFSMPTVPFYIVAGLVVGVFIDQDALLELALWGIAFLVFVFGLRLDSAGLRYVAKDAEMAAIAQIAVVAPLAYVVALAFGFGALDAVYFAAAATLSSTLVGMSQLDADTRSNLVHGRLASSVHLFDDLIAIFLLLILSAESFTTTEVTSHMGYGVLFLAAAVVFHRYGFGLFKRAAGGSSELLLMGSISLLIVFVGAAELADISIVVGAFAAGVAVRNDDIDSLDIHDGVESIKDFFAVVFFVSVGALVVTGTLVTEQVVVTVAVAGVLSVLILVVNPLVLMAAFSREGYDPRTGFMASTNLNQVSELSLVIAIQAVVFGEISETMFDIIILAAAATMILASLIHRYEYPLYSAVIEGGFSRIEHGKTDERSSMEEAEDHVIIVGYGLLGRRIAEECDELGKEYVVIENDPVVWGRVREDCDSYVFGDAMSRYTWEVARVEDACLIVSTVDYAPVSDEILGFGFGADVFLMSNSAERAVGFLERGATFVNVPNVLAADRLRDNITEVIEASGDDSPETRAELRERHLEKLDDIEPTEEYDRNVW